MLLVSTYLAPSLVHGTGVFARRTIKKGAVVWRLDTRCDRIVSEAEYVSLPAKMKRDVFEHHATAYAGLLIVYGDHARFFNHSRRPNLKSRTPISDMVAARPIRAGEEMFVNYFAISDTAFEE
jgi:uncharacterized protein